MLLLLINLHWLPTAPEKCSGSFTGALCYLDFFFKKHCSMNVLLWLRNCPTVPTTTTDTVSFLPLTPLLLLLLALLDCPPHPSESHSQSPKCPTEFCQLTPTSLFPSGLSG